MLAERLGTSDEWIRTRTGIGRRHVVDVGTATSDLAVEAGERALKSAGGTGADLVVLATTTPDRRSPATAPLVAARLGLGNVPAFDVAAVCTGFIYALATAAGAISSGIADRVLVIGAEAFTSIIDPADRNTAVIFGDGAGALVLQAGEADAPGALLGFDLGSDGSGENLIMIPAGGSRMRSPQRSADVYFGMQGQAVFVKAVTHMLQSARTLLGTVGWPTESVDWFIGHQANIRILHSVADGLGLDRERAVANLDRVGNTSAASIPLALADAADRLKAGDRVLLSAFGGGLTWGSTALTWPDGIVPH
jgi:3-oxoacyl-[acyl-carrier-protein] synthase-3